mmetsp:Transcript_25658/g.53175  ORF Transcript_25658/g.53175 Transcript_25658/m.53175 type:complete len:280 (-) Transcript_25658:280-1119(-)
MHARRQDMKGMTSNFLRICAFLSIGPILIRSLRKHWIVGKIGLILRLFSWCVQRLLLLALLALPLDRKASREKEAMKHHPEVSVCEKHRVLAKPSVNRVFEELGIGFNSSLHSGNKVQNTELAKDQKCHDQPNPSLTRGEIEPSIRKESDEHDDGPCVHKFHCATRLTVHTHIFPFAIISLHFSSEKRIPTGHHHLSFTSPLVVSILLLIVPVPIETLTASEVPPTAQTAAVISVVIAILLFLILALLPLILVVTTVVSVVLIAFPCPFRDGDNDGEER